MHVPCLSSLEYVHLVRRLLKSRLWDMLIYNSSGISSQHDVTHLYKEIYHSSCEPLQDTDLCCWTCIPLTPSCNTLAKPLYVHRHCQCISEDVNNSERPNTMWFHPLPTYMSMWTKCSLTYGYHMVWSIMPNCHRWQEWKHNIMESTCRDTTCTDRYAIYGNTNNHGRLCDPKSGRPIEEQ